MIDGLDYNEKKWCLIANNYADFSGVNNYMAYTMYQEIGGNSAMHVEPVDLYVDGEYRGIYLVTDKVEIGTNRVDVTAPKYSTAKGTPESQVRVIVENYDSNFTDPTVKYWQGAKNGAIETAATADDALSAGVLAYAYADEQTLKKAGGYVLEVSHQYTDEAGWFITNHGVMISFKEPERPTQAQVQAAAIYVQQFEDALYSATGYNSLGKHYSEYLDIESLAKTYLLSCFTGQNDFLDCSDYLNLEPTYDEGGKITGGKLKGGPAWDYDVSNYATDRLYADKVSTNVNGNQAWISQLLKHGDFTDALYKLKTGAFADAVTSMKGKVDTYGKNVAASLAMDQLMWNRTMSAQQQYDRQKTNFLTRANTTWDAVWNDAALKGVSIAVNEETGEIVATANTTGNAAYQWYKLNENKTTATECTGATNAAFTPSKTGTYFVKVTGTAMNAAVASAGHSYSGEWSSDENNHWHDCTVEGHTDKKDLAAHNWNDGVVTTKPTCTTAGVKTYTCSDCGATKTAKIEPTGHDWSNKDGICKNCQTKCSAAHNPGTTCPVCGKYTPIPVIPAGEPAKNPFNPDAGKTRFVDVSDNAWYASAVNYVVDKGLMNGTGSNKFSPNADTTRGMIVTVLARLDGKNTAGTPWYAAGQRWAMEYEISDGTNMTGAITREQLVAMLFRYAVKNGLEAVTLSENLTQFTDASDISAWAVSAMQWAVGQGLIQGSNGLLRPQANASRAEVATILMRFCELLNK